MEIKKLRKRETGRKTRAALWRFFLFLFFLAYLISFWGQKEKEKFILKENPGQIWVEQKKIWGTSRIELEEYLVGMLARTIPAEFEPETLKAQAVILRSHCLFLVEKEGGKKIIKEDKIREYYFNEEQRKKVWKEQEEALSKKVREAVNRTKGKVILYQGEITAPPFFLSGNGKTRDIKDYPAFGDEYGYMRSVACEREIESEDYSAYLEIPEEEFLKKLENKLQKRGKHAGKITLFRDSSNYVKTVEIGEMQISGEEFREMFQLPSSCFQIEKMNHIIQFKTMGKGHGFGFSQFQANELAKEGKTMEEILEYFFQEIRLEKI